MRIVIDAINFFKASSEEYKIFAVEILNQTIQIHPETEFFVLINEQSNQFISQHNVKTIIINSSPQKGFFFKWKYRFQATKILKKIKPDAWIYLVPNLYLRKKVPSLLFIPDPIYTFKGSTTISNAKKKHQKNIAFADMVISFRTLNTKSDLKEKNCEIEVFGRKIFKLLHYEDQQKIKDQYTAGKEFFAYRATDELTTTINLLKAFSLFKKRQQSNMMLVVIINNDTNFLQLEEKLATFKYKNDVILLKNLVLNELWKIIASAYAFIHLEINTLGLFITEALQCETPVITTIDSIENNVVLYTPSDNAEKISQQMQLLFKDENLRNQLIQNAKAAITTINRTDVQNRLWICINKAINKY